MNKKISFLLILVFLSAFVFAQNNETSFAQKGYSDFSVTGANETKCTDLKFLEPVKGSNLYPILSVGITFGPATKGDLNITTFLNGETLESLDVEDFYCNGDCWKRIFLEKEKLLEENDLKVCITTSDSITNVTFLNNSTIGSYETPVLKQENLEKCVTNLTPLVGENVNACMRITNTGSKPVEIELRNVRQIVEDLDKLIDIQLIGESLFKGTIEAGETKEAWYKVRPKKPVKITLPPGVLYYENIFGEPQVLKSNHLTLNVKEPEKPLEPFILIGEIVNGKFDFKVAVKNNTKNTLYNALFSLQPDNALNVEGEKIVRISQIESGEIREINFSGEALNNGSFDLDCSVKYLDYNLEDTKCNTIQVVVEDKQNFILYGAIALAITAVLVYLYINYSAARIKQKELEKKQPRESKWKLKQEEEKSE